MLYRIVAITRSSFQPLKIRIEARPSSKLAIFQPWIKTLRVRSLAFKLLCLFSRFIVCVFFFKSILMNGRFGYRLDNGCGFEFTALKQHRSELRLWFGFTTLQLACDRIQSIRSYFKLPSSFSFSCSFYIYHSLSSSCPTHKASYSKGTD